MQTTLRPVDSEENHGNDDDNSANIVPLTGRRRKIDYLLLLTVIVLLCIGIIMVYSSSWAAGYTDYQDASYFFKRQLIWVIFGTVGMIIAMQIDYHFWERLSIPTLFLSIALLIAVLERHIGQTTNGAQRWITFGSHFSVQPSELVKLTLALYIATWLSRKGHEIRDFAYGFIPFTILLGIVLTLVMFEPDLGTALIIAAMAVAMFYTAGANIFQLLLSFGLGLISFSYLVFSAGYRHNRLAAFLNPWIDPRNNGYHTIQGLVAIGSGGFWGLGLGASRQKAGYLPFPYTDSIFAITGEELGFIGCVAILLLFGFLAYRGIRVAMQAPDTYGALLATGITTSLVFQALINIGVTTNSIPFTGVTLPFVSYGGSSLGMSMLAVGVLLNISRFKAVERKHNADTLSRWRNRWARLPRPGRSEGPSVEL